MGQPKRQSNPALTMTQRDMARQIVCEEWHLAVKEFGLRPGSQIETVVSRIIMRLDNMPGGTLGEEVREEK